MSVATRGPSSSGPTNRLPRSPSPADRGCEIRLGILGILGLALLVVAVPVALVRSQALRTIAAMVARYISCADVHLYGIDCGNGALLPLTRLPHCGAVVQRSQTERATRLITRLQSEVLRRQDLLGAGGFADVTEQRAATESADRLPHLLVRPPGKASRRPSARSTVAPSPRRCG